ncbi:MAG TPA: ABC transporter ATP-binding protein [Acidobacteriaceae bacterium]|jgi:subfamily B ATP-binding cassette protein MsbA|nr:ABC transporter ATP-binding protein [Acidobacteriaceae bacterium]
MKRLLRLLRYAAPYTVQALASVLLMAIVGLLDAFRVLLIKPIFDEVLKPADSTHHLQLVNFTFQSFHLRLSLEQLVPSYFHNAWTMVAFALVASTAIKSLCDYLGTYLSNFAGYGMITDLRNDLYESILRRSVSFFQKHSTGTILSTLINDVERVQFAMSTVMSDFLQQFFTLLFLIAVVILYGGKLAWVLLLFVPVVISSARRIGRRVRSTTRTGQDKLAEIQNILHETVTGNRIVKAFSMELWELTRFRAAARRLFRANLRSVRAQAISSPLMDAIGAVAIALLLLLGRIRIQQHAMTEGAFFTFTIAVFKLYDPVRKFALYYNSFQQALGASSSIFKFIDAHDDVQEKPHAIQLKTFHDAFRFHHVNFSYADEEGQKEVLHDIDLTVKRGEVIAFVGPSGAGKTTLVNLIPRFYDVSSGQITIDGHDLRDVTLYSLRTQIAKVTQETILFNDTVRNNIAYGLPDVPKARIIEAAKTALAHEFIEQMPEGYDTIIGEKGFRMSGGERQRLAIARALLKDAPILILDEATSALDAQSEALVQTALANLMHRRTVFVIAHRLSTVRRATRIAVMEDGHITAIGSYEELLKNSATFQRLHELQFFDISEAAVAARSHL